jgi:hypothetical protein
MAVQQPEGARSRTCRALLMALGALGLVLVTVWFRCRCLGNIPGINGDEAWYGVQAVEMLHDGSRWCRTPTGNPANPFFLGPLTLLHAWLPSSVALLRSVAVASGLAALAVNWLLCRWVFDRATAAVSTVLLAIWPVAIVYSRFAWDASQSVLATLPVVYLSLATLQFPRRRWLLGPATVLAIGAAVWVHPTNLFAAGIAVAAMGLWQRRRPHASRAPVVPPSVLRQRDASGARVAPVWERRKLTGAVLLFVVVGAGVGWTFAGDTAGRWLGRAGGVDDLVGRGGLWHVPALVARLHTGQTPYSFIPGSQSWLAWPGTGATAQWGVDVVLFWAALGAAGVVLWRSVLRGQRAGDRGQGAGDRALLVGWGLTVVAFLLVAGPSAMLPGWERYALCLVVPTTLLLARGAVLAYRAALPWGQWVLAAASLLGWLLVADFEAHYFRFLRETGGRAHATFHTGPVEPKLAALRWIATQRSSTVDEPETTWVVTSEWWNYWPLRYLASDHPGIEVLTWEEAKSQPGFRSALGEGRVFLVEFAGNAADERALARAIEVSPGLSPQRHQIRGYGEAPVLSVLQLR